MFEAACNRADFDYDFQTIFEYCEYLMREHINDTIAKKNSERKEIQDANRAKIKLMALKFKPQFWK
jgi:hypothetical protein